MKINLKNGKQAILRRIRGKDYDDVVTFVDKFSKGKGAIWTTLYSGKPPKDKEKAIKAYESDNCLFLGVWFNNEMIAEGCIEIKHLNHPWQVAQAKFALCVLEKYTSLGIGTYLLRELEKWAVKKKAHRIRATVRHNNKRAIGLYLKLGYQIEGIARETAFFDNEWQHEYYITKIVNA